jgi:hypothetical protein
MPSRYYSAIAQDTTVIGNITSSATDIVVGTTVGYPSNFPFVVALDYSAASEELVLVNGTTGTTLHVTRGYNGTSPQAHNTGAVVRHVAVAQDFTDAQLHYDATTGVHGVSGSLASATNLTAHTGASNGVHGATGAVVGTTDTQTLTNKNLTSGTNTFPTSLVTTTGTQTLTGKTIDYNNNTITNLPSTPTDPSIAKVQDVLMLMGA